MMQYDFSHQTSSITAREYYPLHHHLHTELYLFIRGDCKYQVEGITYPLKPYDLIIIKSGEMHRVLKKNFIMYERMILEITSDFFRENDCAEYEKLFLEKEIGQNCKIDANTVITSGLKDAFARLSKYSDKSPAAEIVKRGIVAEILHIINNLEATQGDIIENKPVQSIAEYITDNLTQPLSLDKIADEFFISKSHLCRIFKAATGLTVNKYITMKRLNLARTLFKSGNSLNSACIEAGFSDYSSFYRAYVKKFGHPPGKDA